MGGPVPGLSSVPSAPNVRVSLRTSEYGRLRQVDGGQRRGDRRRGGGHRCGSPDADEEDAPIDHETASLVRATSSRSHVTWDSPRRIGCFGLTPPSVLTACYASGFDCKSYAAWRSIPRRRRAEQPPATLPMTLIDPERRTRVRRCCGRPDSSRSDGARRACRGAASPRSPQPGSCAGGSAAARWCRPS